MTMKLERASRLCQIHSFDLNIHAQKRETSFVRKDFKVP